MSVFDLVDYVFHGRENGKGEPGFCTDWFVERMLNEIIDIGKMDKKEAEVFKKYAWKYREYCLYQYHQEKNFDDGFERTIT